MSAGFENNATSSFFNGTSENATTGLSTLETEVGVDQDRLTCFMIGLVSAFIVTLLSLFGFVGNTVSIMVMWEDRKKSVMGFLLLILSFGNIVMGLALFLQIVPMMVIRLFEVPIATIGKLDAILNVFVRPIISVAKMANIWLTLQITIHRYIVICCPTKAKTHGTLKVGKYQAASVLVFTVLTTFPGILEHRLTYINGTIVYFHVWEPYVNNAAYEIGYKLIFYDLFSYIIPLSVLVILTYKLIKTIKISTAKRRLLSVRELNSNDITIALLAIVVVFLLCQVINPIFRLLEQFLPSESKDCLPPFAYITFAYLTGILHSFNAAVHFVIYIVLIKRFRKRAHDLMCGCHCTVKSNRVANLELRAETSNSMRFATSGMSSPPRDLLSDRDAVSRINDGNASESQ